MTGAGFPRNVPTSGETFVPDIKFCSLNAYLGYEPSFQAPTLLYPLHVYIS